MCGINGFNFRDKNLIREMNQAIKHRGPDDEGIYLDKDVSLGNVRLAIIDLSLAGHMPMSNRRGNLWITYNGEIYNFKELRRSLKKNGYRFKSNTDTEVILYLYDKYGENCVKKLNGMFAFAIWDKKKRELFLARDRAGIKPLYYFWNGGRFIFSSELKSLLSHKIPRRVNELAVQAYMRLLYIPGETTIWQGIKKLLPGHGLILKGGNLRIKHYWEIDNGKMINNKSEIKEKIRALLTDSVKRQLVADRPVGIFLSGGIDSTTILALATKIKKAPLSTFSVGFDIKIQSEKYNADFYLARRSAQYYKSQHHEVWLNSKKALETFTQAVNYLDEPIANPNLIPIYLLAQFARKKVVVTLGGDGGDELFGGYDRYWQAQQLSWYQQLPLNLRSHYLNPLLRCLLKKDQDFEKRLNTDKPLSKYFLFMAELETEVSKILTGESSMSQIQALLLNNATKKKFRSFFDQFSYLDFKNWLPEESLAKTDLMTMAHGLEQRVPFLDNRIIDLAFHLPWRYKLGWRYRKKILRESFAAILPKEILSAPKRGFFTPAAKWLRDKWWIDFVRQVLGRQELEKHGFFDSKVVEKIILDHVLQRKYNLNLIWVLLTFQIWYNLNMKDHGKN